MKKPAQLKMIAAFAILAVLLLLMLHFYGAQLGIVGLAADHALPGIVSSESFKRAVMHPEQDDAYSAYGILAERHSDVAHEIALQQLSSKDDYLWMNAAQYLGSIGDPASVPYLIKALRHTAWRADNERAQLLVKLTGYDFGTDFTKWQHWWPSQHPDFQLDWESHLGFQPRIQKEESPKRTEDRTNAPPLNTK